MTTVFLYNRSMKSSRKRRKEVINMIRECMMLLLAVAAYLAATMDHETFIDFDDAEGDADYGL